jgi:hypothetical protein
MNVFYLDENPTLAAQALHDKHVVKMTLETAQIMSTVYVRYRLAAPYSETHQSHPSVLWAGNSHAHYLWLVAHGLSLAKEYTHRYGKVHACEKVIRQLSLPPVDLTEQEWQDPPQCMPEEFRASSTLQAYRNYYLSRKIQQSRWTRRDAPDFVKEYLIMAKKPQPAKTAADELPVGPADELPVATVQPVDEAEQPKPDIAQAPVPLSKLRGPRGVAETAKITLLAQTNPKRPNSKAHMVFSQYRDGMTVGEFCDAVNATVNADGSSNTGAGTPNLVYDARHGFISIEGYTPPDGVIQPKPPKPPKAPKEPKATKVKAEKAAPTKTAEEISAEAAAVEAAVTEEVME